MSVTGDNDIYEKMVAGDVHEVVSSDFIYLKCDNREEKILPNDGDIEEEILDQSNVFIESNDLEAMENQKQNQLLETEITAVEEIVKTDAQQIEVDTSDLKQEWKNTSQSSNEEMITPEIFESQTKVNESTENIEAVDEEEETIAIFATAEGKQLALYRVDGSDEIYAVSVFNESGEPPTQFQYLMSTEVERLIKQGVVRTVKKPIGLKSQLISTEAIPPVQLREPAKPLYEYKPKAKYRDNSRLQKIDGQLSHSNKYGRQNTSTIYSIVNKQPDVNYIMLESLENDMLEGDDTEEEVYEESSVQYLLCDEQADSELTYDDVLTLEENVKGVTKSVVNKPEMKKKPEENSNGLIPPKSVIRHSVRPNIMQNHRKSNIVKNNSEPKMKYLKEGNTVYSIVDNFEDAGKENTASSTPEIKVKRPRKQKLTSVNRGDSEIIIQPASMMEEEEEVPVKKRNRRKRKSLPDPDYNPRTPIKKMRKKHSRVEVIDIDMDLDEEDKDPIEEITLDDGKEKNSSDKENNVIMVGDSDEDSQESDDKLSTSPMKCQNCSRNFRQKRLLEAHIRICSKSSSTKKEFTCKTCQEKFDAALSLARHVRANHPPRRGRPRKITQMDDDDDEDFVIELEKSSSSEKTYEKARDMELRVTTKVTRSAVKEMKAKIEREKAEAKRILKKALIRENNKKHMSIHNCTRCLRSFLSLKEIRAHFLQHVTRSVLKYCKVCKTVAATKEQLERHIKLHEKKKPPVKPVVTPKVIKELDKAAEETPVAPRKRGRPRKVKPAD